MNFWYKPKITWQAVLLLPLSFIVLLITIYKRQFRSNVRYSVPVIVVGNITVGGTGKTPMIVFLIHLLKKNGITAGVVSRGYGGKPTESYPIQLTELSSADEVGDEPVLIARKANCPVVVDPNRHRAVNYLLAENNVDVVISDDGMQHYAMGRDMEVIMVDGTRYLGNQLLMPSGPLREAKRRLNSVDFIISKQYSTKLESESGVATISMQAVQNHLGHTLTPQPVKLCSGIGNFNSFQKTVESLGFTFTDINQLSDHEHIDKSYLSKIDTPILMTEKDYVKIKEKSEHLYYLPISFVLTTELEERIVRKVKEKIDEKSRNNPSSV